MPIQGDTPRLRDLAAKLGQIPAGFKRDLARRLGATAVKQLDDGFRASRDPYGTPWEPLTSRTGKPLNDTGTHLLHRFGTALTRDGFKLTQPAHFAATHQYGATITPKRAKRLRFRVRGAPSKSQKRGKLSPWIYALKVEIPRRQMVPERDTGGVGSIWGSAFNAEAEAAMRERMKPRGG